MSSSSSIPSLPFTALTSAIQALARPLLSCPNGVMQQAYALTTSAKPTWLVAYSGGVDSTALLHALNQWKQAQPEATSPTIVAVMVNHGWRPAPTPELASAMVQCKAWGIPLIIAPIAKATKPTETEARFARYNALKTIAQRENATAIWLAHHADDQLETMLIRLCRGTGLEGLQGMLPLSPLMNAENVSLVRPWLGLTKQNLVDYAVAQGLKYQTDVTNADTTHPRNHLRHTVLPALEQMFPQAKESLLRFQAVAAETMELAENAVADVWPTMWDDALGLDTTRLSQCSPSLQGALIRRFLKQHYLLADYAHVQRVRAFITGETRDIDLEPSTASGIRLSVERPASSLHAIDPSVGWFLSLSQHRLSLTRSSHSQNVPLHANPAAVEEGLSLLDYGLQQALKPLAFRLMDLFPLRRPPAVVSAAEEDKDDLASDEASSLTGILGEDLLEDEPASEGEGEDLAEEVLSLNTPDNEPLISTNEADVLTLVPETPLQEARPKRQTLFVSSGDTFVIERLTGDDVIPNPLPDGTSPTVYVTLEPFLVETLAIRTERSGDRFHPLGSLTSMRLKSYLASQSNQLKNKTALHTPLLACGDEILWAVGVGVAEALRVTRRPTHRLTWEPAFMAIDASSALHEALSAMASV